MSIIDRFFLGKIIKDFGTLDERFLGIGKTKHGAFLVEKYGRRYFVIKTSMWAFLSGSFSYEKFSLDGALKIRDCINESEQIEQSLPPLPCDVSKIALRNSLITAAVASVVNLLAPDPGYIFLTTFVVIGFFHATQFVEFWNHPDVNSRTKRLLIVIPLITLFIAITRFCWLTLASKR